MKTGEPKEKNLLERVLLERDDDGCETPGRPWLIGTHDATGKAVVFQPRCKLWGCPYCAKRNAMKWTARALHGSAELIEGGGQLNMLTLTNRGGVGPAESLRRWRACWPKLSARLRRASKTPVQYYYVHERHKSGVVHVHFIMLADVSERWFKDNGATTGFGYMNDYKPVESYLSAGSYAAKYLAKQLDELSWPKGWRRTGTSRGWPKLPVRENAVGWDWVIAKFAWELRAGIESVQMKGYHVEINGDVSFAMPDVVEFAPRPIGPLSFALDD